MDISIVVSIRQWTGNNEVEVVGECEKGYNQLALYAFAGDVIKNAIACGAEIIPWTGERQLQKFCYAFRFETEEGKKQFLRNVV